MVLSILKTADELGQNAAEYVAGRINSVIKASGGCRLLLSTGASQFETLKYLKQQDIDWSKVEAFHLDEYVGMGEDHGASFVKYLKERFCDGISLKKFHFIDGTANPSDTIERLTHEIRIKPIDVALIGIGENGHVAFNDPPADFDTKDAYHIVTLDDACRRQQFGEGWFPTFDDVPKTAISMTVYQIMQANCIISCVPHAVKAQAVLNTLSNELTNLIPATILKTHADWALYLDENSASLLPANLRGV